MMVPFALHSLSTVYPCQRINFDFFSFDFFSFHVKDDKLRLLGNFLMVQCLELHALTAKGSVPGWGTAGSCKPRGTDK